MEKDQGAAQSTLPVIQADRELWKWLLDAEKGKSAFIDTCDPATEELQRIARHRTEHSTPDRNAVLELAKIVHEHGDIIVSPMGEGLGWRSVDGPHDPWIALTTQPEPTDPAGVSELADETAWLVEFPPAGDSYKGGQRVGPATPTQYYCAVWRNGRLLSRTDNPNEAMRFARQQDALAMIERLNDDSEFRGCGRTGAFAAEHMWVNSGPAIRSPVLEVVKEALEPFKEAADLADERMSERYGKADLPDDTSVVIALNITLGHLRDARAALQTIGAGQ